MKIIRDSSAFTTIVLEEGDVLKVSSLKKNNENVIVKCLHSTLHIDEISTKKIHDLKNEERAIKTMEDYLREHEED